MTHLLPTPYGAEIRVRPVTAPTYWRCEPGWSWHARPLPDHLLWYVLDGVGHLTLDGRRHALAAGSCVLFAPGDEPVAGHDPRRRLLVFGLHLTLSTADGAPVAPAAVVPAERCCRLRDPALAAALASRSDAAHRRGDRFGSRQSLLCLEQLLCLYWDDATRPAPERVDAALEQITQEIRQDPSRRWTVAELAARAALSRAQFTRRFTAYTGMSPARYLIRARIDRAGQLLAETNMSVGQVAATLGYTDLAYFSRQYKQCTGHPPGRRPV
ncbi:AraC family transcriptional regulator [Actinoallomurus sp. NPDC050550]|uniref:AraC family transcriptional regulator n=1 Tax=Actinoallomurus sp. NPDC050550 TaxID=3154937 RepID=UPI0033C91FDC